MCYTEEEPETNESNNPLRFERSIFRETRLNGYFLVNIPGSFAARRPLAPLRKAGFPCVDGVCRDAAERQASSFQRQ